MAEKPASSSRFDDLRARNPELGFAIYAYEPGGPVTLEVLTPDGKTFAFKGLTEIEALNTAFPPEVSDLANDEDQQSAEVDIFD